VPSGAFTARPSSTRLCATAAAREPSWGHPAAAAMASGPNRPAAGPGLARHPARRHLGHRHLARRHLARRHLARRHLAHRHLARRHLARRHLAGDQTGQQPPSSLPVGSDEGRLRSRRAGRTHGRVRPAHPSPRAAGRLARARPERASSAPGPPRRADRGAEVEYRLVPRPSLGRRDHSVRPRLDLPTCQGCGRRPPGPAPDPHWCPPPRRAVRTRRPAPPGPCRDPRQARLVSASSSAGTAPPCCWAITAAARCRKTARRL
jgi:hypothetical protein